MTTDRCTFQTARGQRRVQRILDALVDTKLTVADLATRLHMGKTTVREAIRHLQAKPNRRIRVKDWELVGNTYVAQYALGSGPDKRNPGGEPRKVRRRRAYRRMQQDPVAYAQHLARKRLEYWDGVRRRTLGISL